MKTIRILLAGAALLSTGAAHGADLSWNNGGGGGGDMFSSSSAFTWTGFYAGLSGGYGFGAALREDTAGGPQTDDDTGGFALGGQAGYNLDLGGFVLGTEADLSWSNLNHSETAGGETFRSGIDGFGTVRLRAGASFGQVMPYVTGGVAAGRGSASITDAQGVVTSQGATHLGWTAGAGLEAAATENITFKAEYLYTDLGTQTYGGLPGGDIDVTQRFSVIRAGINYKF